MVKLFGILTAVTLAVAAFIATKNNAAYESAVSVTEAEKDKLAKSEAKLAIELKTLADLPVQVAAVEKEIEELNTTKSGINNEAVLAEIDEKKALIVSTKQKVDEIREKSQKTGDLKELASKMRANSAELEELNQSIATQQAQLDTVTAQQSSSVSQVARAKTNLEAMTSGQSLPTLKTRIRSIYANWGFVTLAGGNNAGVVGNSILNVVREGETIARLLVTAVESNTASASIIPDSVQSDVTLMVGDSVVSGGSKAKAAAN